jgi:hypothetical protein
MVHTTSTFGDPKIYTYCDINVKKYKLHDNTYLFSESRAFDPGSENGAHPGIGVANTIIAQDGVVVNGIVQIVAVGL